MSGQSFASPGSSGIISSALELLIDTFRSRFGVLEFNFVISPNVKALIFLPEILASFICNPFLIVVKSVFNIKRPSWCIVLACVL